MISDTDRALHAALAAPFTGGDLEWKVQTCGKKNGGGIWALVVPYLSARAIQSRLDEVVGPGSWRNRYEPILKGGDVAGFLCYLAIHVGGAWVEKCDGAELTDIEPVKGGLSNALKRCAVQWGLGRYLYGIDTCWANVHANGKERAKTKDGDWFNWDPPAINVAARVPPAEHPHDELPPAPAAPKPAAPATPPAPPAPKMGDANKLAAKGAVAILKGHTSEAFATSVWDAWKKGDWLDRIDLLTKANAAITTILDLLQGRGEELVTEITRREKAPREIVADLVAASIGDANAIGGAA